MLAEPKSVVMQRRGSLLHGDPRPCRHRRDSKPLQAEATKNMHSCDVCVFRASTPS